MIKKYQNSILLSAVGDALGWITEFEKTKENIISKYGQEKIGRFYKWRKYVGGRFNGYLDEIKEGSYSDDTQLLLSVARSINPNGTIDNIYFSKIELPNWLLYARGAGRTIKNAAKKIQRKSVLWNNNFFTFKIGKTTIDYRESGANGAAMRILPIALANFDDFNKLKENIFSNSIITHGHPRAIAGAILYGLAVSEMLKQDIISFNFDKYLTAIGKNIKKKLELSFIKQPVYIKWLLEWNKNNTDFISIYEQTSNEILLNLRYIYKALRDKDDINNVLNKLGCFTPNTKGSGVSTVIAGIYIALKYYDNPEEAIITAVNQIGSDTDSIAAFTGGLIGALYDKEIIPGRWKKIQDYEYLIKISEYLYDTFKNNIRTKIKPSSFETNLKHLNTMFSDVYELNENIFFTPLGKGKIIGVDRQKTLTKGKYNLIIDVQFEIGQSCRFSKILDINKNNTDKYFE